MSAQEFGIDNDEIKHTQFNKYQGKKGQEDRVGLVFEDPKKAFVGVKCYFHQRYFLAKETAEFKALVEPKLGLPKWRVGCLLAKYRMDNDGKLVGYDLVPWIFKEKMYANLKSVNKEFPLDAHDLKLKCTNEQFQNIEILSCKESFWRKNEKLKQRIIAESKVHFDMIKKNLASDLSMEEIKELFGVDTAGSEDAAQDVDLGGVADLV